MRSSLKLRGGTWNNLKQIEATFGDDAAKLASELQKSDSQLLRRSYCRSVFAYGEAVASWLKQHVVLFYHPGMIGDDEKQWLEQRSGALESYFRAFDLFTNVAGADTPFNRESAEWHSLHSAIKIRNRITHPQSGEDAVVTDQDLAQISGARLLLAELLVKTFERVAASSSEALAKYEAAFQKRIRDDSARGEGRCNFGILGR